MTFEALIALILGSIAATLGLAAKSYKKAPPPVETKVTEKEVEIDTSEDEELVLDIPKEAD